MPSKTLTPKRDPLLEGRHDDLVDAYSRADVKPDTINEKARSVRAEISHERPVMVFDFRRFEVIDEILIPEGMRVRGDRDQVPLLENHFRGGASDVIGSVRDIRVEAGKVTARLDFVKDDPDVDRIWNKVAQRALTDVSVGYRVINSATIEAGKGKVINGREYQASPERDLRISTEWELRETSVVPIGADEMAQIRQLKLGQPSPNLTEGGLAKMPSTDTPGTDPKRNAPPTPAATPPTEPTPAPTTPAVDVEAVRNEGWAAGEVATHARISGIYELARTAGGIPPDLTERAITEKWDLEKTGREFLKYLNQARTPAVGSAPAVHVHGFDQDVDRDALTAALMMRVGINPMEYVPLDPYAIQNDASRALREQAAERGHRFRDLSFPDLARFCATLDKAKDPASGNYPITREEFARAAASGGTMTHIFTTSINARLQQAFQEAPDTTQGWINDTDVPNFLTNERIGIGQHDSLARLAPGGTAEHASRDSNQETYKIARYARQIVIDEQDIINDRMDALMRTPADMGRAAARLVPDLVYSILLANANMRDAVALFAAGHNNDDTNALNAANLKTGVLAMGKQTEDSVNLNIDPRFIIVPIDLKFTAQELIRATQIQVTTTTDTPIPNINVLSDLGLSIRADNRIGAAGVTDPVDGTARTGSATTWFLSSGPGRTIEVGHLAGSGRRAQVRRMPLPIGQFGMGWDVKRDVGAKALDWRGLYRGNV